MRHIWVLLTAAAAVSLGACSTDADPPPSFAVADSAGVEVVTTSAPPWDSEGSPWSVVLATEIGELDGAEPYLFGEVAGVALLAGGGFAVADAQSGDIRFFSDAGEFTGRIGRFGDGPGEFQSFGWMAECGGSLVAYDWILRRVTTLSLDGEVVDTRPFETPEPGRPPYNSKCLPDGSLVAVGWGDPPPRPDGEEAWFYAQTADAWRIMPDGVIDTIGSYISSERIGHPRGSGPHAFSRSVVFAGTDSTLIIGGAERLQVEVRATDGTLTRILRGPDAELVIDDELIARYQAADLVGRDSMLRADLDRADYAVPPRYPAYSELMVDDLGYIWAERFVLPWAEERRWGIFDPDGVFLGHVDVPRDFDATDVDATRLAGVATDELGVPRVRVYELSR
jgi:hypothetical protein